MRNIEVPDDILGISRDDILGPGVVREGVIYQRFIESQGGKVSTSVTPGGERHVQ